MHDRDKTRSQLINELNHLRKEVNLLKRAKTEQKNSEIDLIKPTHLSQKFLDNIPSVALLINSETREIIASNKEAVKVGAMPGKTCYDTWIKRKHPCPWCLAQKVWVEDKPQHIEVKVSDIIWDVYWIPVDENVYLHYAFDITERRRLQSELVRAQRLETAGRIAGQIAHDFNNLLGPMAAYPTLIREELPRGHPVLEMVNEMEFTAIKISEINQQLLALGRRGHYSMEPTDLNDLLQKVILSQSIPTELIVREELNSNLFLIKAGTAQLTRALINLINNAKESMHYSGILTLRTENVYLDTPLKGYKTINTGEYVKLEVADIGCGIEPEILEKIFDPFFTTKKMDKVRGSGLGLSVVHSIVEDHNGYITVASTPGKGTAFVLYFPVTRDKEIAETVEKVKGGSERILVVDDDPVQRRVASHLLKSLGYNIHAVPSGEQAVKYVKKHPQDLLIIDMIMDGIDGTETYRQILEFQPIQKAVIMSGFAISQRVKEALRMGAGSFVTKPITLKVLATTVRKELDKKGKRRLSPVK